MGHDTASPKPDECGQQSGRWQGWTMLVAPAAMGPHAVVIAQGRDVAAGPSLPVQQVHNALFVFSNANQRS